jgi:hypothetical protein
LRALVNSEMEWNASNGAQSRKFEGAALYGAFAISLPLGPGWSRPDEMSGSHH